MKVLLTGVAGFIGMHTAKKFLDQGHSVLGIDNLNEYYDVSLKHNRLDQISDSKNFSFEKIDIANNNLLENCFKKFRPDLVINLAAQAGVRYSLENPHEYIHSNINGFLNILEGCRHFPVQHLVYASSSSVYGLNQQYPFHENHNVDHPISLYAASKKSNELMAHAYSHLYKIPSTGLRFFTVYGPWGRPDMALFLFADAISKDKEIQIFNDGEMIRDFTYIDDIVEGIFRLATQPAEPYFKKNAIHDEPSKSSSPYRIFNIGNSSPINLMDYIEALERQMGTISKKIFLPMQPGDVMKTQADTSELQKWVNYKPSTSIEEGIKNFYSWYKDYYSTNKKEPKK